MFEWAGASIFFVVLFLSLGYLRGLFAALMSALIYPALQLLGFVPGGAYSGFFGWANPLRYVGAISLLLLLPAVIRRSPGWRGLAGGAVLGVLWGGLSYVAQENLAAGLVGALAIGALLLLSGSSSWRSVLSGLAAVAVGFVLIWLPVLAYYLSKGLLGPVPVPVRPHHQGGGRGLQQHALWRRQALQGRDPLRRPVGPHVLHPAVLPGAAGAADGRAVPPVPYRHGLVAGPDHGGRGRAGR